MSAPLRSAIEKHSLLILDGAMGTELQRRGVDTGLPLWSANALLVHPEIVQQIHTDYIDAGANIITANTFRTTRRTMKRGKLPDRSQQLTRMALEVAHKARDARPEHGVLIAGSIAPLEDCYRPDLVPGENELQDEHGELAERLAAGGVDFIIAETMGTIREAMAVAAAAIATGKEVIVSFICNTKGELYSGESLSDAVAEIMKLTPTGISLNCISPHHLHSPLATILQVGRSHCDLIVGVYGNIGIPESEKTGWEFTQDVSEKEYASFASDWIHAGATMVGGCCGTTPEYIRVLSGVAVQ